MVGGSSIKSKMMLPEKLRFFFLRSPMASIQGQQSLSMGFRGILKAEDHTEPDSQCVAVINELLCHFKPASRHSATWRSATRKREI